MLIIVLGQVRLSCQIELAMYSICMGQGNVNHYHRYAADFENYLMEFTCSFTLDTGCSASMYCIHNAVRAIQSRDCDSAIVAAANLITSPEQHMGAWAGGILSSESTCRTFDVSADGYGRGEAVNAVYLKRLSAARKDGDKVWAVIRGAAVNA